MAVNDGSANASAGSPQYPNLLDSYGANRPAWNVAGVDYHVGVPEGLALKNPATISMAGVTVNSTTKVVTVTGSNVTLDGYDFSLNGGWQVSVQAANTTITNSNFLIGSNNLAPIISTAAASNMTVSYCTIDGAGKDPGWGGLISYRGNGFTVEDSWLKNAGGDMIQQIDGGANSTVVIQNNLIQNGGMASGAHGDYTQLAGGPFNVSINYNTTTQSGGTTQGLMTEYVAGGEIGHNTMLGSASYFVSVDNSSIKTSVTVHDNYYDPQGFGFVYPNSGPDDGNAKSIYVHNVNMKTGAVLQDSNAPAVPPASQAPSAPKISSFSNDSGVVGDNITNDNTLTLTGTAAANGTVKVFDGATQIGTATANSSGAWSFTTSALADGAHNLTAKVTDASGQTSAASATLAVKIDTTAPAAPVEVGDSIVNGNQVLLNGTAEANSTVKVYDGLTLVGTTTTKADGTWSVTTSALSTGSHDLIATATDVAGNTSVKSLPLDPVINGPAPGAPTIASFSNDTGVAGDHITSDNTLTLTGTAAANATVKVFDGATQIGTATASSSGAWSFTTAKLADGAHNLTAKATDASGQTSAASAALAVKIDTAAPNAPTVATPTGNANGSVTVTGTAEANSTVQVFDGKAQVGTATANSSGAWSLTTGALTSGNHTLTAKATDAAGNVSAASAAVVANIPSSTPAPSAPKISSFSNDSGVAGDNITSDNTLTLKGTAAANATVKVFDGTTQIGTATTNGSGAWSFTTAKLADGAHNLAAKVTDSAGQTSAASATLAVKIDTTAPVAPKIASGDAAASTDHVTLAGTAEANSTVHVFDGKTQIGTATANEKGAWTYVADSLSDGSHSFTTKAMDAAGNTSGASSAFDVKIDTHTATPSPSAEFTKVVQNWNDTVTFKGTADPHSQISIYDNDGAKPIGSVKAGSDGSWSYKTPSAVSDGVHSFTATVTDKAGNTSSVPGNAVLGTNSNDVLKSTSANELFKGNGGHDTFVFTSNFGADTINDFRASGCGHDVVQFSKSVFDNFADVLAHAAQSGHDVVINAGGGNTLTLKDTKLAALDKADFHFV